MASLPDSQGGWGSQYRLVASEKWKAKSAAMGQAVTDALVEYAQPKPGMQVLDLASGTGEPAISLAMCVGSSGHVTALDLSADLLQIAKGRAQARGLQNLTTQQGDAHSLPFPLKSFALCLPPSAVLCSSEPIVELCASCRALRPRARACFLAWGTFQ